LQAKLANRMKVSQNMTAYKCYNDLEKRFQITIFIKRVELKNEIYEVKQLYSLFVLQIIAF